MDYVAGISPIFKFRDQKRSSALFPKCLFQLQDWKWKQLKKKQENIVFELWQSIKKHENIVFFLDELMRSTNTKDKKNIKVKLSLRCERERQINNIFVHVCDVCCVFHTKTIFFTWFSLIPFPFSQVKSKRR